MSISPETPEGGIDRLQRLAELEGAIREHCRVWESGEWMPKDDEKLWNVVSEAAMCFPYESLPPCGEFMVECAKHQTKECDEIVPAIPDSLTVEEEIALYTRGILRHKAPRGHDLCWEHHIALHNLLPERRKNPAPKTMCPLFERLRLCIRYREAIEGALRARNQKEL